MATTSSCCRAARYFIGGHSPQTSVDSERNTAVTTNADSAERRAPGGGSAGPAPVELEEPGSHHAAPRPGGGGRIRSANPARSGYDITHWNSIEPHGNAVIASFRHARCRSTRSTSATASIALEARRDEDTPEFEGASATRSPTPWAGNTMRACTPTVPLSMFDNRVVPCGRPDAAMALQFSDRPGGWDGDAPSVDHAIRTSRCPIAAARPDTLPKRGLADRLGPGSSSGRAQMARSVATRPTASAPSC